MVEIKTDTALEAMREAGRVVAHALAAARAAAAVRVRLRELDVAARAVLTEAGARSPFLGYQPSFAPTPFPAVICASVNDAVSHGIPGDYRLRDGDLVSIDCGAELDGWTGDAAISFTVGPLAPPTSNSSPPPNRPWTPASPPPPSATGSATSPTPSAPSPARPAAGMPADFGGHGIGRQMHEDPHMFPTTDDPAALLPCATASPSPSTPPTPTAGGRTTTTPTPTDGPGAPATAAEPHTSNTPSPSPRTAPVSSPCPDLESAPSRPPDTSAMLGHARPAPTADHGSYRRRRLRLPSPTASGPVGRPRSPRCRSPKSRRWPASHPPTPAPRSCAGPARNWSGGGRPDQLRVDLPFHLGALTQAGRAQALAVPVLDLRTRLASGPRPRGCWTRTPVLSSAPRWARTGT